MDNEEFFAGGGKTRRGGPRDKGESRMLDTAHILYMLYSGLGGAAVLLALYFCKSKRANKIALRAIAIVTILLHYSTLWVEYFTTGAATVRPNMILLIYPCHVCMWLLLISSFLLDRDDIVSRTIKDFTFWGGTVCGAMGVILNEVYSSNPVLTDYYVLKGLLSHSTMVTGCILLFTAGFVSIRLFRGLIAVVAGLSLFVVCGHSVNALYEHFGLPACNAMFLQELPFENAKWVNIWNIGLSALALVFVVSVLFEQFALPREQRWYARLGKWVKKQRTHTKGK